MNRRSSAILIALPMLATAIAVSLAFRSAPAILLPQPAPEGAIQTYEVDAAHSSVIFKVKHLGISDFYGRFNDVSGTVSIVTDQPHLSSVSFSIPTASIDTNSEQRDTHLKSPDFFNAVEFPTITFKSVGVKIKADGELMVAGELTFHGQTQHIKVQMPASGEKDAGERFGVRAAWTAAFTIKRSEFGVNYGVEQGALGDEVHVIVCLECVKK